MFCHLHGQNIATEMDDQLPVGTQSIGGFNRPDGSPCSIDSAAIKAPLSLLVAIEPLTTLLSPSRVRHAHFRLQTAWQGKERNAIRLKTDQRNLEVQKGMMCWFLVWTPPLLYWVTILDGKNLLLT